MTDGSLLVRVDSLHPDDFLREAHGAIFAAIRALADRGEGVDLTTVQSELEKTGRLERAGGAAGVSALVDRVPDVEHVESYARTVREASRRRRLLADLAEQRRALEGGARLEDVAGNVARSLDALAAPEEVAIARPVLVALSTVKRERVSWLWPGRVPFGKLTLLEGDPGLGKSTLALDLIARATTGRPMPDGGQEMEPMSAIILSAEDGLADTIHPRLEAAEADLSRVLALKAVKLPDGAEVFPTLTENLAQIRMAVIETGARIVIVDPFVAYIGADVNTFRDQDVRRCLAPLAALAEELGVAVILIRHLTKGGGSAAIYRGGGSIGIVAACRSALLVAKDPEDEDRRVLAPVKSNLCAPPPSLAYRLESASGEVARVAWERDPVPLTAHDLLSAQVDEAQDGEGSSSVEEAAEFLDDLLQHGPVGTIAVKKAATEAGHAMRTVWRAKKRLGIVAEKPIGSTTWQWRLPSADDAKGKAAKSAKSAYKGRVGTVGTLEPDENAGNTLPERAGPSSGTPVRGDQVCQVGAEVPARRRERLGL